MGGLLRWTPSKVGHSLLLGLLQDHAAVKTVVGGTG